MKWKNWMRDQAWLEERISDLQLTLTWGHPVMWEPVRRDWKPLAGTDPRLRRLGSQTYAVGLSAPLGRFRRREVEDLLAFFQDQLRQSEAV